MFGWDNLGWALARCAPCGAPVNAELVRLRMGMRVGRPTCVTCHAAMLVDVEHQDASRLFQLHESHLRLLPKLLVLPTGFQCTTTGVLVLCGSMFRRYGYSVAVTVASISTLSDRSDNWVLNSHRVTNSDLEDALAERLRGHMVTMLCEAGVHSFAELSWRVTLSLMLEVRAFDFPICGRTVLN